MKRQSIYAAAAFLLLLSSCSTTRTLQEGEFRLVSNKVVVEGDDREVSHAGLEHYLKQVPAGTVIFGWNPFMSVYNWKSGKGGFMDRFLGRFGVAPTVFDPALVDDSVNSLGDHLDYMGYYGSEITPEISSSGRRKVKVTYNVRPGRQYYIKAIEYDIPEGPFKEEFMADTAWSLIHRGIPLSEQLLASETERGEKKFRNEGYYTFNKNHYFFVADTLHSRDSVILDVIVREYSRNENPSEAKPLEKYEFGNVSISYPAGLKFRESVLKGLNTVIPGDTYSENVLNSTYSRLSALQVFNSVNLRTEQGRGNKVDCSINLSQSKLQGYKLDLEASTNSSSLYGLSPQVSYYHRNIFHGGEWLSLSFMGNFQFRLNDSVHSNEFGVSTGLSFPKFIFLPYSLFKGEVPRTDLNLLYNYQSRPEYTRNIITFAFGYSGTFRTNLRYQFYPLQLSIVHLDNLDPNFYNTLKGDPFLRNAYQDHFDLGSGAMGYYSRRGFYTRLQLDLSGNILSIFNPLMKQDADGRGMIWSTPYSQYLRSELNIGKTWSFGRNDGQAIATRFLAGAGWAYGNSSALPFEKHFYAGGANSMRGWQTRSVGPGTSIMDKTFRIPNQTGDMKLEANLEYRFDWFWKIEGALFTDIGNIWTLKDDSALGSNTSFSFSGLGDSLAANWGLGIRLDLNFLLLRIDMGMKLHDPARQEKWVSPSGWLKKDGYALHFGVGYPF